MVKPTRIHSVTMITEANAGTPDDCHGTPGSRERGQQLVDHADGLVEEKVPIRPTATPEITSGR